MNLCRATAYRYMKALLIGPSIALALYACSDTTETNNTPPDGGESHTAGNVTGSATWGPGNHTVLGTIVFTNGTLTIEAGATVVMTAGGSSPTSLTFGKNAGLVLQGNATAPVVFTSSSGTPAAGDWGNLEFEGGSLPSQIGNANFAYGGAGGSGGTGGTIVIDAGTDVLVTNTTVEQSLTYGVLLTGDANIAGFVGNTLTHNTSGPISLPANSVTGLGQGIYTPNDVEGIDVQVSQLASNSNWINLGVPYILEGLTIETLGEQAILTVGAGVKLLMAANSALVVQKNGGLVLAGTSEAPVIVTSAAASGHRGDWADIEFYSSSLQGTNTINYALIQYGGGSGTQSNYPGAVWIEADATAAINNSNVTNSASSGVSIQAHGTLDSFSNNTLANNAQYAMQIDVDDVRQLQQYNNTYVPNDSNGIAVSGSPLSTSTHWRYLGTNYYIQNMFNIDYGLTQGLATLTLDAGTQLTLANSIGIDVSTQGQFIANGTADSHVEIGAQGAQVNDLTFWTKINFLGPAQSELHYTRLRYGGSDSKGMVLVEGATVVLDNIIMGELLMNAAHFNTLVCGGSVVDGTSTPIQFGYYTDNTNDYWIPAPNDNTGLIFGNSDDYCN